MVRGVLILDEQKDAQTTQEFKRPVLHTGFNNLLVFPLVDLATRRWVKQVYLGKPYPKNPINNLTPAKTARNMEIRQRYFEGELLADLARYYGISVQRIHQIVHFESH